jgi:hypothetical protein
MYIGWYVIGVQLHFKQYFNYFVTLGFIIGVKFKAAIVWLLDLHQYTFVYYHYQLQLKWCVVLDIFLYDFCQWVASDRRVSTGALATSNNKTQCHEIIEILFKVELNTDNISTYIHFIRQTLNTCFYMSSLDWFKKTSCNFP